MNACTHPLPRTRRTLAATLILSACALAPRLDAQAQKLDAALRRTVVEEISKLLDGHHVFPDKGRECGAHVVAQNTKGAYDEIADPGEFARRLTRDMHSVHRDLHLRVETGPPSAHRKIEPGEEGEAQQKRLLHFRRRNYGFHEIEFLDGLIGYLDLRSFAPTDVAGETAVAAMALLANTEAVIIDLRKNGGGSGTMIQLIASYFFEEHTLLCSFETRGEELIRQTWTLPHVPGRKMYDTPLYILTSGRTGSAAEEFAYDFKHHERATLIGSTTGGGGHTCVTKRVAGIFNLVIPHGRPIHPVTGHGWEGVGVKPHIEVPVAQALVHARRVALEKLLEEEQPKELADRIRWALEAVRAELEPVEIPVATLTEYAGRYGPVRLVVEDDTLWMRAEGESLRMTPTQQGRFLIDSLSERVEFVRNDDGEVTGVLVVFENGQTRRVPRTS